MKQNGTELKREVDNLTIIARHINTPLSIMDRASKQKVNKDGRLEQHYASARLTNIYRALHQQEQGC